MIDKATRQAIRESMPAVCKWLGRAMLIVPAAAVVGAMLYGFWWSWTTTKLDELAETLQWISFVAGVAAYIATALWLLGEDEEDG